MTPCIHHGFPHGGLSAKFCWAERASMMAVAVQSKDQKNADNHQQFVSSSQVLIRFKS